MLTDQWPASTILELYLEQALELTDRVIRDAHQAAQLALTDRDNLKAAVIGRQLHPVIRRRRVIVKELQDIRARSGRSTDLPGNKLPLKSKG
jgi:hypothetical protein